MFAPVDAGQPDDGATDVAVDSVPDADPFSPFGAPVVAGVSDPVAFDSDPTMTGDRLEICFTSTRAGGIGGRDIWCATRPSTDDAWSAPFAVAELNTTSDETNAELAYDGLSVYISRNAAGGIDIYVSSRPARDAPWATPVPIAELTTTSTDYVGNPDDTQLRIMLGSNRAGGAGGFDIWESNRPTTASPWSVATNVAGANTAATDRAPAISADGHVIYFASSRPGGSGGDDLYVAARPSLTDPFAAPIRMVELCSSAGDYDPWVSPDGHHIVFASERGGNREIYEASR